MTLYNKRNMAAEFSWMPVVGKDGTAFSVRPARGSRFYFPNFRSVFHRYRTSAWLK